MTKIHLKVFELYIYFLINFKPMMVRKKIYYVPGLISALLIPILFGFLGNRKLQEPITNVMDIGLPAKPQDGKESNFASFEPYRNWNYQKIAVKSNSAKSNSKYYVSEIKKLQKRNVKNTGIEFILDNNNSYGDFASILNDLHIAKHDIYGVDIDKTGHIFALVDYKNPNAKEIEYECLLCNDVIYDEYKPSFFDDFKFYLQQFPKEAFYLIFGFLIFLNISMLSIKESFQIH